MFFTADEAQGYDWHQALPVITHVLLSPADHPRNMAYRPETLSLTFKTRSLDGMPLDQKTLTTPAMFPPYGRDFYGKPSQQRFLLAADTGKLPPETLADYLVGSYFEPYKSNSEDAYALQLTQFKDDTLFTAFTLLERLEKAFRRMVSRIVPREFKTYLLEGRTATITFSRDTTITRFV